MTLKDCSYDAIATIITTRKRSLGQGNVFTPACHSVHRGWGSLSREGVCLGGGSSLSSDVLYPGGLCPLGLCPGASVQGSLCPRGFPVMVVSLHTVNSGQYASYWNAFLFIYCN